MIQFLALQVLLGKITIDRVPEAYRAAVETYLATKESG